MLRWIVVCAVVSVMSLLVVGCAPGVEPASPTPTQSPTTALTLMVTESPTSAPGPTLVATLAEGANPVKFTIVYDNNAYDERLRTAWGFSCWVEVGGKIVLFDTGGDGPTLLGNMAQLGFDPQAIDAVVLSHIHGDHTGGLAGLLDAGGRPVVYVPAAFPASFKADVRARTDLVEVTGPVEILPGVYTTGEVGSRIVEQALVVETAEGLVVVTGCAHPGVVEMVRRAQEAVGGEVAADFSVVMGGFHLGDASADKIDGIIADFRQLGVRRVAPCHCTGDQARQMFANAFGYDCVLAGVGYAVTIDSGGVTSSPPSKGGASRDLAPHGCEEPFTRRLSPSPATGCGLVEAKSQDIQSGVHVPWSRESAVRTDMLTIRERLGHNATAVGSGADLGGAVRVDSLDQRTGSSGLVPSPRQR